MFKERTDKVFESYYVVMDVACIIRFEGPASSPEDACAKAIPGEWRRRNEGETGKATLAVYFYDEDRHARRDGEVIGSFVQV